jgi:ferric iron reductase protein FhuF
VKVDRHASNLLQAIDGVTVGDYDCFAGQVIGRGDPRSSVSADRLLDAGMLAVIEQRFKARFGHFEPRAVHSIWMKWYLNIFIPPFLLADVLLARGLSVALDQVRFAMSDDGRIAAVVVDDVGRDTTGVDPFERFSSLIFDHFEPLIEIWSARTDVMRRVYWSNVGNTFEAMLRRIEKVSGTSPRLREAQRLLDEPLWPGGRPNPLAGAVYYDEANTRMRRVCCLQYMLPDRRFCKACPIDEAQASHANKSAIC